MPGRAASANNDESQAEAPGEGPAVKPLFDAKYSAGSETTPVAQKSPPAIGHAPFDAGYGGGSQTIVPGKPYGTGKPRRIVIRGKITRD
jgi:hypothetical protein